MSAFSKSLPFASAALLTLFAASCAKDSCNSPGQVLWGSICRPLGLSFTKTVTGGTATCGGVVNSHRLQFTCPVGANANCASVSNGQPFYFVLIPNNGGGIFLDGTVGPLSDCDQLWNAMNSPTPPTDILGVYFPSVSEVATCTGVSCTFTSTACFAAWDPVAGTAATNPAVIPAQTLLACGFIATGAAFPPPAVGSGLPAISSGGGAGFYNFAGGGGIYNFAGAAWSSY